MVHIVEAKQERSRQQAISSSLDAAVTYKGCPFHSSIALDCTARRSCRCSSTAS